MIMPVPQAPSPDKLFYDNEAIGTGENHAIFVHEIGSYFSSYVHRLESDLRGTAGTIIELGAGSCTLSCKASLMESVRQIVAADISSRRMEASISSTAAILNADVTKISTVECDFNQSLPFHDASADAILFDAALHHARDIWNLLSECRRVLRPQGVLIAQRESYLSPLRARRQLAELLRTPEVSAQVSENMYLKAQYEYYLKVNGFSVDFVPYSLARKKKLLGFANGWLFVDGTLYCRRA